MGRGRKKRQRNAVTVTATGEPIPVEANTNGDGVSETVKFAENVGLSKGEGLRKDDDGAGGSSRVQVVTGKKRGRKSKAEMDALKLLKEANADEDNLVDKEGARDDKQRGNDSVLKKRRGRKRKIVNKDGSSSDEVVSGNKRGSGRRFKTENEVLGAQGHGESEVPIYSSGYAFRERKHNNHEKPKVIKNSDRVKVIRFVCSARS